MVDLESMGKNASAAARSLYSLSEEKINDVIIACARAVKENEKEIIAANEIDVKNAEGKGLSAAFIDRLKVTGKVIDSIVEGMTEIVRAKSPVGKTVYSYENKEQGISIVKKSVPFGVVGIIFESRPNVTADAFALCFKTSNAVILKGGSDSIKTNAAIVGAIKGALKKCGVDENAVSLIEDSSRETATRFMKLDKYLDLLIPRGSASLIKATVNEATVPVIETGAGNCHVYVDEFADLDMAAEVIYNAKTQRYSVCNACESLVIHSGVLQEALDKIYEKLQEKSVKMYCDERSYDALCGKENVFKAENEDFYTEYGGPEISVKTVDDLSEAIEHINKCSTHHSEAIITRNKERAKTFMEGVDSAVVYENASTRFSDGFLFGLGAEIGISTQKLHARGPMGLEALCTTKYFVSGNGAVRK